MLHCVFFSFDFCRNCKLDMEFDVMDIMEIDAMKYKFWPLVSGKI